MNRLQGLEASVEDHIVTLNAGADIDPETAVAQMTYAHLGWGFHEDGERSGLAAATRLGSRWQEQS